MILKPERAAMQSRHRGGKRKPQTRTRTRARPLEPYKAFDNPRAIGFRYPRAIIGNAQFDTRAGCNRTN